MSKLPSGFSTFRDAVSFIMGSVILVFAIFIADPPPETLSIGVGLALVGLPATSLMGGKKNDSNNSKPGA